MLLFNAVLGVFSILGGVYCVAFPSVQEFNVGWIIGFLMLLAGICTILDYFLGRRKDGSSGKVNPVGTGCLLLGIAILVITLLTIFVEPLQDLFSIIIWILFLLGILIDSVGGIVSYSRASKNDQLYRSRLDLTFSIIELAAIVFANVVHYGFGLSAGLLMGIVLFAYGLRLLLSLTAVFRENGPDLM